MLVIGGINPQIHKYGLLMGCVALSPDPATGGGASPGIPRETGWCQQHYGSTSHVRAEFPVQIADGWAIGWDNLQWMLLRRRKRHAQTLWHPHSYIASEKRILRRCMRENGVPVTAAGEAFIDGLPDHFRDFEGAT